MHPRYFFMRKFYEDAKIGLGGVLGFEDDDGGNWELLADRGLPARGANKRSTRLQMAKNTNHSLACRASMRVLKRSLTSDRAR